MSSKTNINSIGVWFVCKSCQLTFPFRTVDEFLDHKAEKHFAEFQETQCVVFEEKEQSEDELFVTNTDEELDTKLFPQSDGDCDVDVELRSGSGTSEFFSGTAAEPVLVTVADPVLLPINRSSRRGSARRASVRVASAPLKEKPGQEYGLTSNFNLFSGRLPSANTPTDPRPDVDLEADLVQSDSSQSSSDSTDISSDVDFSFVDEEHANVEVQIHEHDNSTLNPTLKTPYGLRRPRRRLLPSRDSSLENPIDNSNPKQIKIKTKKKSKNISSSTLTVSEESKEPFVCTICSRSFETKLGLNFHMNSHYGFKKEPHPFKCTHPDCAASFKNEKYLKRHTERHENASSNPRSFINKPFFKFPEPEPDDDTGPNPNRSNPLTFRNWLIEQKSPEKSNSSDPETVNIIRLEPDPSEMDETGAEAFKISGETPIKCKLCSKNLESVPQATVHVTHCWLQNKLRHVYCLPCEKSLGKPLSLNKHSTRKHGKKRTKLNQFLCSLCPKMTKTESHLKRHMESHKSKEERVKPWVCEVCGLAYFDQCVLKYHQMIHGEETPFQCPHPDCARAFKSKVRLSSHLRNHIESKAYSCPKEGCSKSFKTKNELTKHLRTLQHTGTGTAVSRSPITQPNINSNENVTKKFVTDFTETNHFLFDT